MANNELGCRAGAMTSEEDAKTKRLNDLNLGTQRQNQRGQCGR